MVHFFVGMAGLNFTSGNLLMTVDPKRRKNRLKLEEPQLKSNFAAQIDKL